MTTKLHDYAAYVPDLPGCIATGHTLEEVERQIQEAIELHIAGMREDGQAIPQPRSRVEYVSGTLRDSGVSEAQKMELDRRLAAHEIDHDAGSSWSALVDTGECFSHEEAKKLVKQRIKSWK